LVIIDPVKAKGRREIVDSCPYGAIYWNEESELPQKCTGCAHLLDDGWKETRCTQVCPTGALTFLMAEDDEMAQKAAAEGLEAHRAQLGTRPRVWYKNYYRWAKSFLGGTLAYKDTDECVEGATVVLSQGGQKLAEVKSNNYGDFVFDGLAPGAYELAITADGYKPLTKSIELTDSLNLGLHFLEK
jgi:NAD-dependent dihydropyrimidine dehydrogenase PreA subunit